MPSFRVSVLRDRMLASLAFCVGVSLCPLFPSTATALFSVGGLDTPDEAWDVEVVGTLAYVADDSSLRIIDVSNPAAPVELGALDMPGQVWDVEIVGTLA